jgi:hypothetical protein
MKIGSHIKPRDGKPRPVPFDDTVYTFAPVKDKRGVTHFVADVDDADHADALMRNGAFYAFDGKQAAEPALKHPGAPPVDETKWDEAIVDEADALLANNAETIAVEVGKVSGLDVLRCAIAREAAGKARKGVQATLSAALEGAIAAGVSA